MRCNPVLSLGSINADFSVRVDRRPSDSDLLLGRELRRLSGGKALNRAWLADRLGHSAALFGCIGDDDLASQALAVLEGTGVDLSGVLRIAGTSTAVSMIFVPPSGKKQIVLTENANLAWSDDAIDEAARAIEEAAEGTVLTMDLEVAPNAAKAAAAAARRCGMPLVLDPSPAERASANLLSQAKAICPNHSEAAQLVGFAVDSEASACRAVSSLREEGTELVCVKLEDGGVIVGEGAERWLVPRWQVDVADTTGAGDAFAGGLAVGLARGWTGQKSAALGNAAASLTTTERGSQVEDLRLERLLPIAEELLSSARKL